MQLLKASPVPTRWKKIQPFDSPSFYETMYGMSYFQSGDLLHKARGGAVAKPAAQTSTGAARDGTTDFGRPQEIENIYVAFSVLPPSAF